MIELICKIVAFVCIDGVILYTIYCAGMSLANILSGGFVMLRGTWTIDDMLTFHWIAIGSLSILFALWAHGSTSSIIDDIKDM